jgi:hypothetical protein
MRSAARLDWLKTGPASPMLRRGVMLKIKDSDNKADPCYEVMVRIQMGNIEISISGKVMTMR